jgi:hypothetical protein
MKQSASSTVMTCLPSLPRWGAEAERRGAGAFLRSHSRAISFTAFMLSFFTPKPPVSRMGERANWG